MKSFQALQWLLASAVPSHGQSTVCKCFPGDACWPSTLDWDALNSTVGGRLVATIPLGSPCHDPTYDAEACAYLQSQWTFEEIHYNSTSSIMAPFFANQSCDPFQPVSRPCELGNYVRYAVNAESASDIAAAVVFAQQKNVRLVIRNTGHDYLGRSTGAGSLGVRTHNLKSMDFLPGYDSANFSGTAVKIGAGVQGFEIMAAARDRGLVVVGGECPTVGIAGGYTQGGGHSALSTSFGLAADNVLEWEVVLADGTLVTASPAENENLYWALSGGGGGTFGVAVSMTVKAHPDATFGGATVSFASGANVTKDLFWSGVEAFHAALPALIDAGTMIIYRLDNSSEFQIAPLAAYNKTRDQVEEILAPFLSSLDSLGINYTATYTQFDTYYEHMDNYFGPLPIGFIGVGQTQSASRLIPRVSLPNMTEAWRASVEAGIFWVSVATDVGPFGNSDTNGANPAWRDAILLAVAQTTWNFTAPWEEMIGLQDKMTYEIMPMVEAVTPGGGAYANEGDFRQPNFQETFFGSSYDRLLAVKKKYDPENLFYATVAVGSEAWEISNDGRMCAT